MTKSIRQTQAATCVGGRAQEASSLIIGGPYWRLQQRLGLLGPDWLPPVSTALILAAFAWLPLALLTVAQGSAWSEDLGAGSFLLDFSAYARFIFSIIMLSIMERFAEERVATLLRHFVDAGLVHPEEQSRFALAFQRADRRSSSALVEALILGIAYGASTAVIFAQASEMHESWLGVSVEGQLRLSLAAWWTLLVSLPLYWFLLLRWFWRFAVLTRLLWDIAALDLRLVATHPDRSGGIGFLGLYPTVFAGLVFALSCVTAATGLQAILFLDWPLQNLVAPLLVWIVLVLVIFVGPLTIFTPTLMRFKRRALLEYGVVASQHNRSYERKWLQPEEAGDDALGTPEFSSLSDLNTAVQSIKDMRVIPAGLEAIVPLLAASLLPWAIVLVTQVPLLEILSVLGDAMM